MPKFTARIRLALISSDQGSLMPLRQHLLIVDDQRVDRAIGTHAATQIGYKVSCAASIDETRALLETGDRFDFIMVDWRLALKTAWKFCP